MAQFRGHMLLKQLAKMQQVNTIKMVLCRGYSAPFQGKIDGIQSTWTPRGHIKQHQDSLPCQPVPPLKQTISKFLASVKPILNDQQYDRAVELAENFSKPGSAGEKLQELLLQRATERENWLADWWIKVAYLGYREPVTLNVNPAMVAPPTTNYPGIDGQLRLAAYIVSSQILYKQVIDRQEVPIERIGGNDQCMIQHHHILGCCRVPAAGVDYVQCHLAHDITAPRHVTVVSNNHQFHVDVIDSNNNILSVQQIIQQLESVVNQALIPTVPIGMLTSANRDQWYDVYAQLRKDVKNAANFDSIHQSLFVISLDKPIENYNRDKHYDMGCWHNMAGGGSHLNTGNRWNDKILQYFVSHEGVWGFAYEHSIPEGPPILDLLGKAIYYVDEPPASAPDATGDFSPPVRLDFNLTAEAEELIHTTATLTDKRMNELNVRYLHYDNKDKVIAWKNVMIYPDGFVQANLQLAYYKMYGHLTATYESGSLRKFRLGRTDTIRSASIPVLAWCKAMMEKRISNEEMINLLREATTHHALYTQEVSEGQGVDRHLLGLKLMAYECGMDMPQFLSDPVYVDSSHWSLSTTTVPLKKGGCVVFGPVVPDGYGVYYNRQKEWIDFGITSWDNKNTDIDEFVKCLTESLDESFDLLNSQQTHSKL